MDYLRYLVLSSTNWSHIFCISIAVYMMCGAVLWPHRTPNGYAGEPNPQPRAAFNSTIALPNGEKFQAHRRERHQLLFDRETGEPIALFNGALNLQSETHHTSAVSFVRVDLRQRWCVDRCQHWSGGLRFHCCSADSIVQIRFIALSSCYQE